MGHRHAPHTLQKHARSHVCCRQRQGHHRGSTPEKEYPHTLYVFFECFCKFLERFCLFGSLLAESDDMSVAEMVQICCQSWLTIRNRASSKSRRPARQQQSQERRWYASSLRKFSMFSPTSNSCSCSENKRSHMMSHRLGRGFERFFFMTSKARHKFVFILC